MVGIFPNDASAIRLAGALLIEQNDEWLVNRRYPSEQSLALVLANHDQQPEEVTAEVESSCCPTGPVVRPSRPRRGYSRVSANVGISMKPITFTITNASGITVPKMDAGGSLEPCANGSFVMTSSGAAVEGAKRPHLRLVK